jgi:hypothetical protein
MLTDIAGGVYLLHVKSKYKYNKDGKALLENV